MITIVAFAALAMGDQSGGVEYKLGDVDLASFKYVQTYTYCLEDAAIAAEGAAQELRNHRFEQCRAQRSTLVSDYSRNAIPSAVRKLERSLNIIENAYAKGMGVARPGNR